MRFGEVLIAMGANPKRRFTRMGWVGKTSFIYLVPAHKVLASDWTGPRECIRHEDVQEDDGAVITEHYVDVWSHIDICMGGIVIVGWTPAQTDMALDDWIEVF